MEVVVNMGGMKRLTRAFLAGRRSHRFMKFKQGERKGIPQMDLKALDRRISDCRIVLGLGVQDQESISFIYQNVADGLLELKQEVRIVILEDVAPSWLKDLNARSVSSRRLKRLERGPSKQCA